nr:hypothetical protein [uncultured Oscillibacter sp.]
MTVEVYVCPVDADFITDVVVTRTQLMEVDRVASDYVELDRVSSDSKGETLTEIAGYNDNALHVETVSVKDNNYDAYNVLKELEAGDKVAIIPYTTDDGKTWEVGEAYVPETVSGALTNVDIYNTKSKADGNAIAITVGGTTYPIAQWNKDMRKITGYMIKSTKKDVTLLLDKMGNALLAKDVGSTDAWIVVGDYYQAANANGRVGWFVHGWTIKGDEVDLDLGTIRGAAEKYAPGELVQYRVAEEGNGEYELRKPNFEGRAALKNGELGWKEPSLKDGYLKDGKTDKYTGEGVYNVAQYAKQNGTDIKYDIKSVNTLIPLEFYDTTLNAGKNKGTVTGDHYDYSLNNKDNRTYTALTGASAASNPAYNGTAGDDHGYDTWTYRAAPYDGVKFIYVGFDPANGEVDTISFLSGVQNVPHDELRQINYFWRNVGTNDDSYVASPAEAYVDKNGKVKAVVIKSDSAEASLKDLIVITDNKGTNTSTKGGAEAPTSGTYYTRQYVSGEDGFKTEKTGYFDRMLSVGTVVTGRLQSDGIFKTRTFHADEYTNRNPDALYVRGIAPLPTLNDKNSSTEFYIGAKAKGTVFTLGTGVKPGDTELTNVAKEEDCYILSGKDVMGIHNPDDVKGLIKVDGSTQFIDLRDGRLGDITDLDDLLERENSEIELKLILNGNESSDGFRRAYAILILNAGPAADDAAAPNVKITGKVGSKTVKAVDDKVAGTEANPLVFQVAPETEITLNAKVTVSENGKIEDAKWYNKTDDYSEDGLAITVESPEAAEEGKPNNFIMLRFTVTNYDNTVEDKTRTEKEVWVKVESVTESTTPAGAIEIKAGAGMANYVANLTGTMDLFATGSNTIDLSFDAPAWANKVNETAGDLTFDAVLVKADGTRLGKVSVASAATAGASAVKFTAAAGSTPTNFASNLLTIPNLNTAISAGTLNVGTDALTLLVENVKYKNVAVKYYLDSTDGLDATEELPAALTATSGGKMTAAADKTFAFAYDSSKVAADGYTATAPQYKIENATLVTGETAKLEDSLGATNTFSAQGITANGGDFVKVILTGFTKATPTSVTISAKGFASGKHIFNTTPETITALTTGTSAVVTNAGRLSIEKTASAGTLTAGVITYNPVGVSESLTVKYAKNTTGSDSVHVKLVLKDTDGNEVSTFEKTLNNSDALVWNIGTVDKSLVLDYADCKIETVKAAAVKDAECSFDKTTGVLTVGFDAAIDESTIATAFYALATGGNCVVGDIELVDKTHVAVSLSGYDATQPIKVGTNATLKGANGVAVVRTTITIAKDTFAVSSAAT